MKKKTRLANVSADKIVEAHGSFACAHCIKCKKEHSEAFVKKAVFSDEVPKCTADDCGGVVKVFYFILFFFKCTQIGS